MKADDPRLQPGVYRNHKGRVRRVTHFQRRTKWGDGHVAGDVYYTVPGGQPAHRERVLGVEVLYDACVWSTSWVSWLGPAGKWERLPDDWTPSDKPEMTRGELEAAVRELTAQRDEFAQAVSNAWLLLRENQRDDVHLWRLGAAAAQRRAFGSDSFEAYGDEA